MATTPPVLLLEFNELSPRLMDQFTILQMLGVPRRSSCAARPSSRIVQSPAGGWGRHRRDFRLFIVGVTPSRFAEARCHVPAIQRTLD